MMPRFENSGNEPGVALWHSTHRLNITLIQSRKNPNLSTHLDFEI